MDNIAQRLKAYIESHPFAPGDSECETVLDQLYQAYAESHESNPPEIRNGFKELDSLLEQHFIMDNLDAIIEFDNSMKENQGQPWSPEHDRCLLDLHHKGVSISEIAITLKRNSGSVRARLKKLGITE